MTIVNILRAWVEGIYIFAVWGMLILETGVLLGLYGFVVNIYNNLTILKFYEYV